LLKELRRRPVSIVAGSSPARVNNFETLRHDI